MYFLLYRCKLRTEHNIKNNNIFFQPGIAANTIYLKTASAKINHYPPGLCSICFGIQKIKSHVIHKRVFSITKNEFPESFFQIQRRDRYIISMI